MNRRIALVLILIIFRVAVFAESVRKVDFREAPEMKELAERARQIGNEVYPKVLTLLADDTSTLPRQFDIVFKKQLELDGPKPSYSHGTTISLSADWLTTDPARFHSFEKSPTNLDLFLVHEMAHVAQHYKSDGPFYWDEGIADYVRYKLGYTNGWSCPQCSVKYPHYTSGYWCAGAFLLYLDATYDSNVVRQLNAELRRGSYSDKLFARVTGRSLEELWTEFQKTAAYTPVAAELNRLADLLGYPIGKPPRDYEARLVAYVRRQPGGAVTLEAREFLSGLTTKAQTPGWSKDERGWMSSGLSEETDPDAGPVWRTFHGQKDNGDTSIYHYRVVRPARDGVWKLEGAWRTAPDGRLIEENPVP